MEKQLEQFTETYDANSDGIFRYLYYRVSDRERALELTQETFTKTWVYISKGKELKNPRAFLYRVAHNLYVNELRDRKKDTSIDLLKEEGFEFTSERRSISENGLIQKELLEDVYKIPRNNYRKILKMRYIEGLTIDDIARDLHIKKGAVSVRIHRALKSLKQIYKHGTTHEKKAHKTTS